MLLGIGLATVCVLALCVLVDASAAFLQRRALVAMADAAALAGAQSIDLAQYYAEGASRATRLDVAAVPVRVRTFLARSDAASIDGLTIDAVSSDGRAVTVALSAPLRLPFLSAAVAGRVTAQSQAQLSYRAGG
jgi:hypothetical protein